MKTFIQAVLWICCLSLHAQPPGYVNAAVCAGCHPKVAESYQRTGMGRSFNRPSSILIPEQKEPFYHAASETYFAVAKRGAAFVHRRWQVGLDGKNVNEEELEIHYVMGSGNHARTFLHRDKRGALLELPLGWYAEKSGYFAMNPGFDSPRPETRRKIDYDCMGCHNSYPRIPPGHDQPGSEPTYLAELPTGIDCQRCHGPGAKHVAAASKKGTIVNPAKLPTDRQLEVCMQCHLETTSTKLPSMIRRFDRLPFSYTPGEPLGEYQLAFDHAPGTGREDKFEVVNAAYRMRQSKCYLKSPTMTCTTCHDPHGASKKAECSGCHSTASMAALPNHRPGGDCVGCHMPKRRTEDAVHVVMTDHKIQRKPATGLLAERAERHPSAEQEYQGEVSPYYPTTLNTKDALYEAVAQVLHGSNLTVGIPRLQAELELQRPKNAEFYVALGNAWQQAGKPNQAASAFEQAANLKPGSSRELRFLGIALQDSGQANRAREMLERAVKLDPRDAVSLYQLALLDSGQRNFQEAASKSQRAVSIDPDLLEPRNSLGVALVSLGEVAKAEAAFREALRINPYFGAAHGNLARLLAARGDLPQAEQHYAKAVKLGAGLAQDRYEYALTLVRMNRFDEAVPQAEQTTRLSPAMVEARILFGGLLARAGRMDEARAEYEAALRVKPEDGRTHLDLARVLAAQGDRERAIAHLRQAAKGSDATSSRLANQALINLGMTP